jgi:hypothetical protein
LTADGGGGIIRAMQRTVAYVLVPADGLEAGRDIVETVDERVSGIEAAHLCRELDTAMCAGQLPPATEGIAETWLVGPHWLASGLADAAMPGLIERLVVTVEWPVAPEDEMTLLSARLRLPGLRLAVGTDAASAEAVFLYFNRLGFSWMAHPATTAVTWAETMRLLCRLWTLDPRARVVAEPMQTALACALRERAQGPDPWGYRAVDAGGRQLATGPWSPSVHAAFLGRGRAALDLDLEQVADADAEWMSGILRSFTAPVGVLPVVAGGAS